MIWYSTLWLKCVRACVCVLKYHIEQIFVLVGKMQQRLEAQPEASGKLTPRKHCTRDDGTLQLLTFTPVCISFVCECVRGCLCSAVCFPLRVDIFHSCRAILFSLPSFVQQAQRAQSKEERKDIRMRKEDSYMDRVTDRGRLEQYSTFRTTLLGYVTDWANL